MSISNRRRRVERKLALAALTLCGCLALDGASANAVAALAQKNSSESSSKNRGDETPPTRPRRVDADKQSETADGPIIRVGLMADVTSISLGAASTLTIRSLTASGREEQKYANATVRVEVRSAASARDAAYPLRPVSDTNARAAKTKSLAPQVVAMAADRLLASSEEGLVITAS